MSVILFSPTIGPVPVSVFIKEEHETSLGITMIPIETGADVTDHAYIKPKKLTLQIGAENPADTWNALVRFQESRVPFVIVTGLTVFENMLIERLSASRDQQYSKVLYGIAELREIIIVDTSFASVSDADAPPAGKPGGSKSSRSARPTSSRSKDAVTADRAAGTTTRGDAPTKTAPTTGNSPEAKTNRSILSSIGI